MRFLSNTSTSAFAVLFLFGWLPVYAADTVTKKGDTKKVSGTITAMTRNDLTIKRGQNEETVRLNEIAVIDWDGGGIDLKFGYNDENASRLEQALQKFQKAKADAKSPGLYLQGEFEYVIARVTAKQALNNPDKREAAIQKLLAAQKAHPEHIRFFDSAQLLIQLQLATNDFPGARKTIEELKRGQTGEMNLAAQISEAKVLVAEGKIEDAVAVFAVVADANAETPADTVRKSEAVLGQARGLIALSKYDDALKALELITERIGPVEDAPTEAEAFVLQGDAFRGTGRIKDAILAYLSVDILFPKESEWHAQALFQLINLWKIDQHPDRSAEAAGKLVQLYPNSEWRKKMSGNE